MRMLFIVHGFVQGVGYRHLVRKAAEKYHVKGMVKNATDGSVHVLAEADEDVLEIFKDAINVDIVHGPQVRHIEVFPENSEHFPKDAKTYDTFVVERE